MNNNVYLKLENVKKSLANFELDNVSFSLPKGYIMGLIGSNGAGKSTLMKIIDGIYQADEGDLFLRYWEKTIKKMKKRLSKISVLFLIAIFLLIHGLLKKLNKHCLFFTMNGIMKNSV